MDTRGALVRAGAMMEAWCAPTAAKSLPLQETRGQK
jgi:hypothetical protein